MKCGEFQSEVNGVRAKAESYKVEGSVLRVKDDMWRVRGEVG